MLVILTAGCGTEDARPGSDGGSMADTSPASEEVEANAAPVKCATNQECASEQFCGASSKTCVSAVAQVVAGASHSCALHKDGTVSCWGLAASMGDAGSAVMPPTVVAGVVQPLALTAGPDGTCAITSDRRARCWGARDFTVTAEDGAGLTNISAMTLGSTFGCVLNPKGISCWGKNEFGQLARPLEMQESTGAVLSYPGAEKFLAAGFAVVAHDGADRICAWGSNLAKVVADDSTVSIYTTPQCGMLADVAQLAIGSQHACVRHAGGTFACWGERYYGQLGLGGIDTADIPPYGSATSLSAPVTDLVAGVSHTCALLADGTVTCFGLNSLGQVGPGADTMDQEVRDPAIVSGFSGKVVALGAGSSAQHTCAIIEDGSVACWGSDGGGQLGDGVTTVDPMRFSHGPVVVRW